MDRWRLRRIPESPPDHVPFALVAEGPHGYTLAALNAEAVKASLRPGQRLADARAICPELLVEPANPVRDMDELRQFALWARRWCPWTAVDGADTILLDISGAAHLFGGEASMLADMARRFTGLGYTTRITAAPTLGAAWALSHHGREVLTIALPDDTASKLAPLGVASLRLPHDMILLLERLGLKTLGALAAVPRLPLARRFSREAMDSNPLIRLDQAMGRLEEPVAPLISEPPPRVVRRMTEPVTDLPILATVIAEMAQALCAALELRQVGARALTIDHFRIDGGIDTLTTETAQATRDPKHMMRLLGERLGSLDAGFGFDAVAMTAVRHEPVGIVQDNLLESASQGASLSRLIDRLCAKLGARHVRRPAGIESHIPERSIDWRTTLLPASGAVQRHKERPIRLLDRPEEISVLYATPEGAPRRFLWRKLPHNIAKVEGPERIAPEWWRERSSARLRDYYRVEDEAGRRFWLYREGIDGDGRGGLPRWYLHGMFA